MDWFGLYVRSQWERRVTAELERRGIEAYLPVLREVRRWSDRQKQTEAPAFPGYVFARFDVQQSLRVLSITGTVHILGTKEPEPIPEVEIDAVRRVLAVQPSVAPLRLLPKRGSTVRIISGPLMDIIGVCEKVDQHCRVYVAVPMLGRSIPVQLDPDEVETISNLSPTRLAA